MSDFIRELPILLAPASGYGVGGGHVMRCLTLAEALTQRGRQCVFAVSATGADLISRFRPDQYRILPLSTPGALATTVAQARWDGLVIDDYEVDATLEASLRGQVRRLMVIDDLANRPHQADLLLDPGFGRTAKAYSELAPRAVILAGPEYAFVGRAFRDRRPTTATARPAIGRIFISFGLSDPGEIARRTVERLRVLLPHVRLDVAMASDAASVEALRKTAALDDSVRLYLDMRDLAPIMAQCDLCIGAGGSSVWERAVMGLPSLIVVVADNQRDLARRLSQGGYCAMADLAEPDFEAQFSRALQTLSAPQTRAAMAQQSMALCDGRGADRAADELVRQLGR